MVKDTLYIKAARNTEVTNEDVRLSDIAKLTCSTPEVVNRLKTIKVLKFSKDGECRHVLSILKIIEKIHEIYPQLQVESVGEQDIVVELVDRSAHGKWGEILKIVFVCLICFFGTGFTIMAFHNDIGIVTVFSQIYEFVTGQASDGLTILEVSYSIGLAIGIITFFNHIGSRRITKDPTPIEVEMRLYEDDVNTTLIETMDREGKTIDVG